MKVGDSATISVSKKTHDDFERYRAILSAERGRVQTQDDIVRALLKHSLPTKHKNKDEERDDVHEDYVD